MPYSIPGTIAIVILVILVLVVIVSCINIVQQSKAYVVERLGAFHSLSLIHISEPTRHNY